MLKCVRFNEIKEVFPRIGMQSKHHRDYTARHERIRDKLVEMTKDSECGCFPVPKIAAALGMDQRTVRAHLKIIEINNAGVFLDLEEKEFCTREGLILLAKKLGLEEIFGGKDS